MFKDFLIRPKPYDDESHDGFLHRVASENHCTFQDALHVIFSEPGSCKTGKEGGDEAFDPIAFEFGKKLFNKHVWKKDFPKLFDLLTQKFCVKCLKERHYVRAIWDFRQYTSCHLHGVALINRCDNCHGSIDTASVINKHCRKCQSLLMDVTIEKSGNTRFAHEVNEVFNSTDKSMQEKLTILNSRIEQLHPYLRLVSDGSIKSLNDIRKADLARFSELQDVALALMDEPQVGSERLAKQISEKFFNSHPSVVFNPYREVINDSTAFQFAGVMKASLTSGHFEDAQNFISIDMISRLWQVDIDELTQAIDTVLPEIRQGQKRIKLGDFANNADSILKLCREANRDD